MRLLQNPLAGRVRGKVRMIMFEWTSMEENKVILKIQIVGGKFTSGNSGGLGNPHAKQVAIPIFSLYFLFSHLNEFLYCLCT